ncbi:MAG: hypothetical protein JWP91_2649 [Fibrobacteres bacterium]|nr:hypothetical protein [Fibrobacterota bacterium]
MRDMKEKFGAQVESFRYAFVLPRHPRGWDEPVADGAESADPVRSGPADAVVASRNPLAPASAPRRRATDKQPTFIEVKPRSA